MISTRRRSSTRHTDPKVVAEVYVGWYNMTTRRKWRWDVTFYETRLARPSIEGTGHADYRQPSIWCGRAHLSARAGYTLTEWGAWRKIRRAIRDYERWIG